MAATPETSSPGSLAGTSITRGCISKQLEVLDSAINGQLQALIPPAPHPKNDESSGSTTLNKFQVEKTLG